MKTCAYGYSITQPWLDVCDTHCALYGPSYSLVAIKDCHCRLIKRYIRATFFLLYNVILSEQWLSRERWRTLQTLKRMNDIIGRDFEVSKTPAALRNCITPLWFGRIVLTWVESWISVWNQLFIKDGDRVLLLMWLGEWVTVGTELI